MAMRLDVSFFAWQLEHSTARVFTAVRSGGCSREVV